MTVRPLIRKFDNCFKINDLKYVICGLKNQNSYKYDISKMIYRGFGSLSDDTSRVALPFSAQPKYQ